MINLKKPHVHAEVIKAWADGAAVQKQIPGSSEWIDESGSLVHFHNEWRYRVKPEPREFFINVYRDHAHGLNAHQTREVADNAAHGDRLECIRVREVIE